MHDEHGRSSRRDLRPRPKALVALSVATMTAGFVPATWAQDANSAGAVTAELDAPRDFELSARLDAWFPTVDGFVTFGSGAANTRIDTVKTLEIGENETALSGEFAVNWEKWGVRVDAFDFTTSHTGAAVRAFTIDGQNIALGTNIATDLGISTVGLDATYDFFGNLTEQDEVDLRVRAMGGVRGLGIDHRIATIGGGAGSSYDEFHALLEGGVRTSARIQPQWQDGGWFDVSIAVLYGVGGGSDIDLSTLDIRFDISYYPTDNLGLSVGYRQMDITLDDTRSGSAFDLDKGRVAGLYVGGSLTF